MAVRAAEPVFNGTPLRKALTHSLAFWSIAAPLWVLIGPALGHKFAGLPARVSFRRAFGPARGFAL
jgi:hypothetical protein